MLAVILLVVCCSLIEVSEANLYCLSCTDVSTPSACDTTVMCGDGERCYARKYFVDMEGKNIARFDLQCKFKLSCPPEDTSTEYCCPTSYCNRNDQFPPENVEVPQLPPQGPQHTLITNPTSLVANSRDVVTFTCMIQPGVDTAVKMSWARINSVTKTTTTLSTQRVQPGGYPLVLRDVSASDAGEYLCETKLGGKMMSAVATLIIKDEPVIRVSPVYTTANFGDSVNFKCSISGVAGFKVKPTMVWYRKSGERSKLISQQTSSGELPLTLVHVTERDSGTYVCKCVVGGKLMQAGTTLKINNYLSMSRVTKEVLYVKEGGRQELVCEASGSPTPEMKWIITPAGSMSSYTIESPAPTTRINEILDPITRNHAGTYTCVAQNAAGTREMKTEVKLTPKFSVS